VKISPQFLRIRDRVELRIPSGDEVSIFSVRIEDITEDGIYIDRPFIDKQIPAIKPGQEIEVEIRRKSAKYRFISTVIGEARLGIIPVVLIAYPDDIKRVIPKLRRKFLRLNIPSRVVFHLEGETMKRKGYRKGVIIDVSGGGVKFTAQRRDTLGITPGMRLFLTFNLSGELSVIEQAVKVLKIESCPGSQARMEIVCRYSNISPKLMEAIIVHNVRNQRRYRIEKGVNQV